jgi:hypothetical protein
MIEYGCEIRRNGYAYEFGGWATNRPLPTRAGAARPSSAKCPENSGNLVETGKLVKEA